MPRTRSSTVPRVTAFDLIWLRAAGYSGFVPFSELERADVPREVGVYVVLRESIAPPTFLAQSGAGRFKGKDPTVPIDVLRERWIPTAQIVNVGKAGPTPKRHLAKRLREYRRFGEGEPVGHWGGRLIWQLADHADLLVAWSIAEHPACAESTLIRGFASVYGRRPFANLQAPMRECPSGSCDLDALAMI